MSFGSLVKVVQLLPLNDSTIKIMYYLSATYGRYDGAISFIKKCIASTNYFNRKFFIKK